MYTDKELKRLGTFAHTTLSYKPEQLAALSGEAEMTKEIFYGCLLICVKTNNPAEFYQICKRYPEFAKECSWENQTQKNSHFK